VTTIAAIVVCLVEDDPSPLLTTLHFVDEIHLVTDSATVAQIARATGCTAHVISRPTCVEEVGQLLVNLADSDWTLFVDPDERVRADEGRLRYQLGLADPSVAAFDVEYTLSLFGAGLAATFRELRKTKLVRTGCCAWPFQIHTLPRPMNPDHRIGLLDGATLTIASDLADDLPRRFARHALWAGIEARNRNAPVDVSRLLRALSDPLIEYLGDRGGVEDGSAGLANALLHVAKEIQRALFEARHESLVEMGSVDRRRVDSLLKAMRDL
jgi:hypothetical protein